MDNIVVATLGCKLNQLESESIAASFREKGFSVAERLDANPAPSPALVIINTCTVTSKAEQKARRLIRDALRQGSKVVVTGCYAQLNKDDILAIDREAADAGRLTVVGGRDKALLLRRQEVKEVKKENSSPLFDFTPASFGFHSRAALKIQDGCNNHCAFCRASVARGPATSLAPEAVLARLQQLERSNFAEVVITGLSLCQYAAGGLDFGGLLLYLLDNTRSIALRLSSLEPERLSPAFFEALKNPRLRPHFHLSVQSGSDAVLERMGRKYHAGAVLALAESLRKGKDDPFLAADIIAGFCGETDEDFRATLSLCRSLDLAWIHAFPYSRRPDTPAWNYPNPVPDVLARSRVEALTQLAWEGRAAYCKRQEGRVVEAVVEKGAALSENYLKVALRTAPESGGEAAVLQPGTKVKCRLTSKDLTPKDLTPQDLTKNEHFDMIGIVTGY